ncbi:MAG TPA: alkaline phosphatase PafA [Chitinophagaceae bacterium]|nr:alkaline phosphatase PafA [Chitinophagaceae bacterium]
MQRLFTLILILLISQTSRAQALQRPKLVVGIVIDQMRWDYLYRYYERFDAKGGFKRLMNQGFSCENTMIPYIPTVTAPGHSSIYTGSVPAISGITGNIWWDYALGKSVYCTDDSTVNSVGSTDKWGKMSPRKLLVTTICDELRIATNFKSKVIGIAMKDRGCILTTGHSANAAYWFDETTGDWITSTYYMNELPDWLKEFNSQKLPDKYFTQGWSTLFPIETYTNSTADEKSYEAKMFGPDAKGFPYDLKSFVGKKYNTLLNTPFGNTYTAELAKSIIINENMGKGQATDFLAISFKSTDYVGHSTGPNSIETEDVYLRLDKDLGELFELLDSKIGKGQYTVFLSADHGVAQVPEYMQENRMPGGRVSSSKMVAELNGLLKTKFAVDKLVVSGENFQVYLNHVAIDSAKLNKPEIVNVVVNYLLALPGISKAFASTDMNIVPLQPRFRELINNGYYPNRSGDVQYILNPGTISYWSPTGTTHGGGYAYDSHIPLLWYGWGVKQGRLNRETSMTDIAATLAALLHIQMPSGCVGKVIPELMK